MDAGWLITPENEDPISLYFNFFDTEAGKDILMVYDGEDAGAPLLAKLSGTLVSGDTLITSAGDAMWVSFTSDGQDQGKGFSVFYCTASPEGSFTMEGETYPCEGTAETYVVSGQNGTYYAWEPSSGWILQDSGFNFALVEIGSGTGMLEVIPFNRCGEASATGLSIDPLSSAPELNSFAGDTLLCAGAPGTVSVDDLPGATYEWMLPENWLGTSETSEITYIPSLDQGLIRVSASNACAIGDTLSIPTRVKTIPDKTEILSISDKICKNAIHNFYIIPSEGLEYQWIVEYDWNIVGDDRGDTVEVQLGESSGSLHVKASNECGFRKSSRFFLTAPRPETPLLMDSQSTYEQYRKLEVQNATAYNLIQWYLNNEVINSPHATGPSYVAYVPGIYTVGVENQDGCYFLQDQQDGVNISGPDRLYAVYGGPEGSIIVQNTTTQMATINVYDMTGNLMMIHTADPGYNEIDTNLKGVYIVSVNGLGNLHVSRLFIH